jgi:hypothetical protein
MDAKVYCIYRPGPRNVTVEQNVYFRIIVLLEREDKEALEADSE